MVLYGRPLDLFEYRDYRDRDICEHEQREREHIEYLAERVKVDLFPLGQGRYRPDDEGCSVQSPEHIEYQLQKLQGGSVVYGYKGSEDDVAYDRGNRQDRRRHYCHSHIVAGEIAAEDTLEKPLPVLAERLIISS